MSSEKCSAMSKAMETAINGKCQMCGQVRIRKQIPLLRIGFQPSATETFIVCGNDACPNHGKP